MEPRPALSTRWFDGRSPRARGASIRIEGDALLLQPEDGQAARRYALAGVRWPERRSHGQRQTELPDGGLLQHADAAQWDAWWAAQDLHEPAVVGWMQSWRATLLAMAGSVAFLAAAWVWGVPWLSHGLANRVPPSLEDGIGRRGMEQLDRLFLGPSALAPSEQEALRQRFEALVQRAYPQGNAPRWRLSFHQSPLLGPNAFALPGGYIVVTDELVVMLRDQPDTIVGVLAHELGHVQYRHGLDLMVRAGLVGALVGVVLGDASGFLATVPATLATQAYSRDAEQQADAHAARMLSRSRIPPAVMAVFFERLADQGKAARAPGSDGQDGKRTAASLPIAISSHPDTEARIRFFRDWR